MPPGEHLVCSLLGGTMASSLYGGSLTRRCSVPRRPSKISFILFIFFSFLKYYFNFTGLRCFRGHQLEHLLKMPENTACTLTQKLGPQRIALGFTTEVSECSLTGFKSKKKIAGLVYEKLSLSLSFLSKS